ncbi:hypothetical protein ElyMa_002829700 [Elysia marginata]|uniref:Uncharacterized protein n=1 Tax=Elysia marginata TaxID=1093978 RepID=A0AAV4HV44_9GAST|nr:hypothetical protein ElyMa_002829700 [Elysia marginata]
MNIVVILATYDPVLCGVTEIGRGRRSLTEGPRLKCSSQRLVSLGVVNVVESRGRITERLPYQRASKSNEMKEVCLQNGVTYTLALSRVVKENSIHIKIQRTRPMSSEHSSINIGLVIL